MEITVIKPVKKCESYSELLDAMAETNMKNLKEKKPVWFWNPVGHEKDGTLFQGVDKL